MTASASMPRDLASAYAAALSRVASWAILSAWVYRRGSAEALAMLALVRATLGILAYTALGLSPALVRHLAGASADQLRKVYANGLALALAGGAIGLAIVAAYVLWAGHLLDLPAGIGAQVPALIGWMGMGVILRLISDAAGAVLQVRGRIALDNAILAAGEWLWVTFALAAAQANNLPAIGQAFCAASLILCIVRLTAAGRLAHLWQPRWTLLERPLAAGLLGYGILVVLAQVADYLYAPAAYLIINHLLDDRALAAYVPLVQIDAALLVLVGGLASVLLPCSAVAAAAGERTRLWSYYWRGTLAAGGSLLAAAAVLWLLSPLLLRMWLGSPLPDSQALLPWVLVHTVIGGAGSVGRSVLLGMGRIKAFTTSVLAAGLLNVLLSFSFVYYLNLGLRGIVLGTIAATALRCALWMPWYMRRTTNESG